MPQLDISTFPSQIFWLAITFAALFLVMWKVAVPRIAYVLESRQRRIDDNLDKAAGLKREAESAIKTYEAVIAKARADAQSRIGEAAQNIAGEAAKQEAELAARLQERIVESEAAIAKAKENAIAGIRDTARDVAASAVEKLVGDAPDSAAVGQAIDTVMKARS